MNTNYFSTHLIQSKPTYIQTFNSTYLEENLLEITEPHYQLNYTISFTQIDKKILLSHEKKYHNPIKKKCKNNDHKKNSIEIKMYSYKNRIKIHNPKAFFY